MSGKTERRPRNALGQWRYDRLGTIKETAEYRSLSRAEQRLVDYLVRRHDSLNGRGMFPAQQKLADHFGVSRRTIERLLLSVVKAGVFTSERRFVLQAGGGLRLRRASNAYHLNPALLQANGAQVGVHDGVQVGVLGAHEALRANEAFAGEARTSQQNLSLQREEQDAMDDLYAVAASRASAITPSRPPTSLTTGNPRGAGNEEWDDGTGVGIPLVAPVAAPADWWARKGFATEDEAMADLQAKYEAKERAAKAQAHVATLGLAGPQQKVTNIEQREVLNL